MAKRPNPAKDESNSKIDKLIEGLYKVIQTTNATSKEQVRINRELLKTMAVLQSGFTQNEMEARQLIEDVRDGLELNDEYAKKWLKNMGATDKQIDEIVDKFRDLEKIDMDLIDNAEDYLELLNKRYDVLDDTFDLTKRLLTNHDAITKAIRASKDAASKLAGPMGDVDAILEKMVMKKVDVSSMFDGMSESASAITDTISRIQDDISGLINNVGGSIIDLELNFSPLTDDLDREISKVLESIEIEKQARINGLTEYFEVNKKLQNQLTRSLAASMSGIDVKFDIDTGQITTATGILKRGTDEYQAMLRQLDEIADKNNITDKLKTDFREIGDLIASGTIRTAEQEQRLNQLLIPLDLASKMMIQQIDQQAIMERQSLSELMTAKDRYKLMGTYLNQLQTAESIVLKIGSGFDHLNSIMPTGIGEFLGLSKVSATLIESHRRGVQNFAGELEKGVSYADALRSYYKELTPALASALNPMTILVASSLLLLKFASNIADKYKELSGQLKTSLKQSKDLYETQLDILTSQKNQFATMEDIAEAQAVMIATSGKVFGMNDKAAKELTVSLIETGKAFGYGTERAVEMHQIFKRLGADDRLSETLQQNLGLLAESVGLSPQLISDDLIDSAEEVSIYFAGLPEQAAKAAIRVRQMGMSLKQAGSIAQKMLNLEGFMTDMYELQAMSGGGVDFSRAFDKGLMGDIEGMTEDIMNNIGSTAEFNKMDYLTRMKIANTLGMSMEDLAKSVKLREDMQGLSEKDQKYLQANVDRMGDISTASKEEIRNRMQQLQATDRLNVAWDKIKGVLVKSLLPAVELIADAIDAISPLVDIIVFGMKAFGGILKIVFPILKGLLFPFQMIGMVLEKITGLTDSMSNKLSGVGSVIDGIGSALQVVGGILGTIFVVRNIGSFFGIITSGFGSIIKIIQSIVPMAKGMITGLFGTLTGISVKSTAETAKVSQTVTDSASQSINSTKNAAKAAITELNTVSNASATAVSNAGKVSTDVVKASVESTVQTIQPVKTVATQTVAEITNTTTKAISEVDLAAKKAGESIEQVKTKSKGGFLSAGASKGLTKTLTMFGSVMGASLITYGIGAFAKLQQEGEDTNESVAGSIAPFFGSAFAMLSPMLASSLTDGIDRFFRKLIEKRIEDKIGDPLKKVGKSFESLEKPMSGTLEKVGAKGKGIFGKMFGGIKKVALKPIGAVTGALSGMLSKFGMGGGLLGRIFGSVPDVPVPDVMSSTEMITNSVDQVQQVIPDAKEIIDRPVEQTVVEKKKEIVEQVVEKPKGESIDSKSIASEAKKPERSIKKTFQSIGDNIKSLWESIKSSVTDIIQFGIDLVKQIATGIVDTGKILMKGISDISNQLFGILKSASKTLKSILLDIVDFAAKSMKQLSSGIGQSIKNVLKGIGDGLAAFKPQALVGAASLVVLSGALWIASKAIQNFASVKWEDVAKAGVTLGGLVVAGLALGAASPMMIVGAVGIAAIGTALIPVAYAMERFNSIDWSSLAKAGVALVGFGAIASGFALTAPLVLAGSAVLVAASASLGIFAGSISLLAASIETLDVRPIVDMTGAISGLIALPVSGLFNLSAALVAVGGSLLAFSAMRLGSDIMSSISGLFANDLLKDLEKLASLANPLQIAANAIQTLGVSLSELSTTMESIDLSKIDDLAKVGKISVEQKMYDQIQGQLRDVEQMPRESSPEIKVVPVQIPAPKVMTPRKEAVAQDARIVDNPFMPVESGVRKVAASPMLPAQLQGQNKNNTESIDIYNRPELQSKETTFLLREAVKLLEIIAKKNVSVNIDSYKMNKTLKANSNNI